MKSIQTRRVWVGLILAGLAGGDTVRVQVSARDEEFYHRVVEFEKAWNTFYRKLAGCPKDGMADSYMCRPALSKLDMAAFRLAAERARKLFGSMAR